MLSDKQREAEFPIHIDLGEKDGDSVSYPVVDFGGAKGLDQLPDEGCMLVEFKKSDDGSIEAHRICLAAKESDDGEGDYGPKTLASVMDGKMDNEEDAADSGDDEADEGE